MLVVLAGSGTVGAEIVRQLALPAFQGKLTLNTLANSKCLVSSRDASPLALLDALTADAHPQAITKTPTDMNSLIQHTLRTKTESNSKTLFIDATTSSQLAEHYPRLLEHGVHIATPNKKAFSGPQTLYDSIKLQNDSRGLLYHESTVGAGLPILTTLADLVSTGDTVTHVSGVFSGTLSYIFNNFSPAVPSSNQQPRFSEVVSTAKDLGYTEPNPAHDLDGSDVARKLTILARGLGVQLPDGFLSVPTESLVPHELQNVDDIPQFMKDLPNHDAAIAARANANPDKVLRYVGSIDLTNKASPSIKCSLQSYPRDHPFAASLSGSDNIISFQSERYNSTPLIVQGPGAGAAVTAMGVVADALRILREAKQ